jgi:hypothetical protein
MTTLVSSVTMAAFLINVTSVFVVVIITIVVMVADFASRFLLGHQACRYSCGYTSYHCNESYQGVLVAVLVNTQELFCSVDIPILFIYLT